MAANSKTRGSRQRKRSGEFTVTLRAHRALLGLHFLGNLTRRQLALCAGLGPKSVDLVADDLLRHELIGMTTRASFSGLGRPTNLYYLRERGYDGVLIDALSYGETEIGPYRRAVTTVKPSFHEEHRDRNVEVLSAAFRDQTFEDGRLGIAGRFRIERMMHDTRRDPVTRRIETRDEVDPERTQRIYPDAAICIRDSQTNEPGLFFVETTLARKAAKESACDPTTIEAKLRSYWTYLGSGNFRRYGADISGFMLLIVTTTQARARNLASHELWGRQGSAEGLSMADLVRVTSLEDLGLGGGASVTSAAAFFCADIWLEPGDNAPGPLLESAGGTPS